MFVQLKGYFVDGLVPIRSLTDDFYVFEPESHRLVGRVVRRAEELKVQLRELNLAEYQAIHPAFAQDVHTVLDFQRSVEAQDAKGGTAAAAVRRQIEQAKMILEDSPNSAV